MVFQNFVPVCSAACSAEDRQPTITGFELPAAGTMTGACAVVVGEEDVEPPEEDPTERLIKLWEQDVFPKISGRFRNSAERKNGFEQIKGALQFNMAEVAVDTVQMLYEDNGGIPGDLHLPTMDDLKAASELRCL